MPFGMSPAPGIGDRFTCGTVRYMKSKGSPLLVIERIYLFGNTDAECLEAYEHLIWLRDWGSVLMKRNASFQRLFQC